MLFEISKIPASVEIQKQLTFVRIQEWLREDVFHFKWWFLLVLLLVYAIVWWKMVDKTRLHEICLYAVLITIMTMGIVEYGNELTLWDYPIDILPIFPPVTAVDLTSLSIIYSLIYQHFRTWKSFLYATSVMTAIYCFILQPIFTWGGFLQLLSWKYYYGFPIYFTMALCVRLVVIKIFTITKKSNEENLSE